MGLQNTITAGQTTGPEGFRLPGRGALSRDILAPQGARLIYLQPLHWPFLGSDQEHVCNGF
jgi:hypothetical protein